MLMAKKKLSGNITQIGLMSFHIILSFCEENTVM